MTLEKIFSLYWSQITFLLLGIGFLIKNYIDLKSKKLEINHNLFQQKKLESVNTFFSNYALTERMWEELPIYKIMERKLTPKEIDDYILPNLNQLRKNTLELKIYFKKNEYVEFQKILNNMTFINSELSMRFFHNYNQTNLNTLSNDFLFERDKALLENKKILQKIVDNIHKQFE